MRTPLLPISELAEQIRGVTYHQQDVVEEPRAGYIPVLRAGKITDSGLVFHDLVYVRRELVSDKQLIRKHDVLVTTSSRSLNMVGKAAAAEEDFNGSFGAFCCVLRPNGNVDPRYFAHFFRTPQYRRAIASLATGANINSLRREHLDELRIPVPPLGEQRRVAAILDKADNVRVQRRTSIEQLNRLAESIFLEMFGHPATNTKGWETTTLGEVGRFVGGGTPSRSNPAFYTGDICWATSKDIRSKYLDDTEEHITQEAIEKSATKLVPPGSILVVVKSKILARSLPVAITRVPTCFGQDIKAIIVNEHWDAEYVAYSLRIGQRMLLARARGVNTEGLTLEHLRSFRLLKPPLRLQREFAQRVRVINQLMDKMQTSLRHLDELFASLQQRAFRGELSRESLRVS